jgi:hypothetical protein
MHTITVHTITTTTVWINGGALNIIFEINKKKANRSIGEIDFFMGL